jgi:cytochrome c nitrite reductase small subunit
MNGALPASEQTAARRKRGIPFPILLILVGLVGCIVGLGSFTFIYAKGYSYLTDDPNACANCHVMRDVFTAWTRGSHRNVATCNDCHTPHDSLVSKYASKALNGFNHSLAFTLGGFHEPIRATTLNRDIARENCMYCHAAVTSQMSHVGGEATDCLACHARVGHDK